MRVSYGPVCSRIPCLTQDSLGLLILAPTFTLLGLQVCNATAGLCVVREHTQDFGHAGKQSINQATGTAFYVVFLGQAGLVSLCLPQVGFELANPQPLSPEYRGLLYLQA